MIQKFTGYKEVDLRKNNGLKDTEVGFVYDVTDPEHDQWVYPWAGDTEWVDEYED